MTIGDKPIFHIRVKKASAVNIKGAMINSYSSRKERTEKAWDKVGAISHCSRDLCARRDILQVAPIPGY